jgi:hypothetical protein
MPTQAAAPLVNAESGGRPGAAAHLSRTQPPGPVAALLEVGVVDELGVVGAVVEDMSRAHPVWRVVLADGRRLVVKAGIGHGGPDLAVECLVYRMTRWCGPLAAALPVPLLVDEDRQLLVLADVGGAPTLGSLAQQVGFPALLGGAAPHHGPPGSTISTVTGTALGRAVGELHRATAGFPLPPAPPPLVLALVGRPTGSGVPDQLSPEVRTALGDLDRRRSVVDAVDELRRPVTGCLVNHDLKWDNVVLTGPDRRPVLLDWELAGAGDPAWDLGCLLAEHLVRAATVTGLEPTGHALLQGYRDGARPRPAIVSTLAHRVVLSAGLRIVQLALEVAYTPYAGDGGAVTRLTERAEAVLAARTPLTQEVQRCLS